MLLIFVFATLIHLIFTLFKISIQASVYATIVLLIAQMFALNNPGSKTDQLIEDKISFWWKTGFGFSVFLFLFSCSYLGDHGLGDGYRIPVGYGKAIHNGDGVWTYFYTSDGNQNHIEDYAIKDSKLCAEQENDGYLIYDFRTSDLKEFADKTDYEKFAKQYELPSTTEFKDFLVHYHEYWSGWRFWLLP